MEYFKPIDYKSIMPVNFQSNENDLWTKPCNKDLSSEGDTVRVKCKMLWQFVTVNLIIIFIN